MFINNNFIISNVFIFFENFLITNFIKTILIEKLKKKIKKKLVIVFNKKEEKIKKFFFGFLLKKLKFGYYIDNFNTLFLPNNLIDTRKINFPKKIFSFEILFKKFYINEKFFITRKFNFKKKKKINKIKINKIYIGIIKNVINYGIFIDIGQSDGLLHISDIPFYKKIYKNFYIKNIILIKVTKFEKKLKKISLNLKKNYKKNFEKFIFNKIINFTIKNFNNYFIIGYNNFIKKIIICNKILNFKKKDKILAYYIKKNEKFHCLSFLYSLNKKNIKYIELIKKHKFNNFYLLSYKKIKILYKNKIKKIKTKNIKFYKFFLFNAINNEFKKIIFINNNFYIKNNNFIIKIKYIKNKHFNISKIKIFKNKIYFFIRKY